jgi:hypothetical protein
MVMLIVGMECDDFCFIYLIGLIILCLHSYYWNRKHCHVDCLLPFSIFGCHEFLVDKLFFQSFFNFWLSRFTNLWLP